MLLASVPKRGRRLHTDTYARNSDPIDFPSIGSRDMKHPLARVVISGAVCFPDAFSTTVARNPSVTLKLQPLGPGLLAVFLVSNP